MTMGGGIGGIGDAQSTPAGSPRRRRRSLSCEKVATATAAKWRAKAAIAALAFEREWGPLGEGKRREEGREREGGRERVRESSNLGKRSGNTQVHGFCITETFATTSSIVWA